MTRDTAWRILNSYVKNPILIQHSLATEAVMRSLAPRFSGDVEEWGMSGLLHDADYERAKGNPEKHGMLLSSLEPNTIPSLIEHAIQAHNYEETQVAPVNSLDWAIVCTDSLTAFISQLVNNTETKKIDSVSKEFVLEKLQDKKFLKDAQKEHIFLCEEKLHIPLEEFLELSLKAMQGIHSEAKI